MRPTIEDKLKQFDHLVARHHLQAGMSDFDVEIVKTFITDTFTAGLQAGGEELRTKMVALYEEMKPEDSREVLEIKHNINVGIAYAIGVIPLTHITNHE